MNKIATLISRGSRDGDDRFVAIDFIINIIWGVRVVGVDALVFIKDDTSGSAAKFSTRY